jgi:two-component system, chemotaxis family, protein-glutamate methylesterase/glutaminase
MSVRVLVVDDSSVIRKVLCDVLSKEANITTSSAADGVQALEKIESFAPHVVILDLEMPNLDGFGVLRELRKRNVRTPVIVFSTLSERGARATLDALALGASDYLCKPSGTGIEQSRELLHDVLLPKIIALASRKVGGEATGETGRKPPSPLLTPAMAPGSQSPVKCIVIGISTGGPMALGQIFPMLPAVLGVPMVIVQHMPATFTKTFAQRLSGLSKLKVQEATHGELLLPGTVLLAPGNFHATLVNDAQSGVRVSLDQNPPENGCRPAADPLLRSAARIYGSGLLAIVMTGLGSDGTKGCEAVVAGGGSVWVQDESSSVVWGMPGSVVRAGLASKILSLETIPNEIVRSLSHGPSRLGAKTTQRAP